MPWFTSRFCGCGHLGSARGARGISRSADRSLTSDSEPRASAVASRAVSRPRRGQCSGAAHTCRLATPGNHHAPYSTHQ
eukprot:scaffold17078_cov65-Phaeocystis_antarctica.AAC.6